MAITRKESNYVVMGGVDVVEGVKSGFHMARSWLMIVQREEGVGGSKVRACKNGKPSDATNENLIGLHAMNLSRRHVVSLGFRDGIDR